MEKRTMTEPHLGALTFLRKELANLYRETAQLKLELAKADRKAILVGETLAALIHREELDKVEITDDERRRAWEHNRLRVRVTVVRHERKGNAVHIELRPVTAAEIKSVKSADFKRLILGDRIPPPRRSR